MAYSWFWNMVVLPWDQHYRVDIDLLEKVQKRAARFATGNYNLTHGSTQENMNKLQLKPLEERRAINKLKILFKAKHGLIQIPTDHFKFNTYTMGRRRANLYTIPASNVNSHLFSFYPNTIRLWNWLPETGKLITNFEAFQSYLNDITIRAAY